MHILAGIKKHGTWPLFGLLPLEAGKKRRTHSLSLGAMGRNTRGSYEKVGQQQTEDRAPKNGRHPYHCLLPGNRKQILTN